MKKNSDLMRSFKNGFSMSVIPVALGVAIVIYIFVLGNPNNFMGGDNHNHPLPGNYFGVVYKGGPIVPILMSLLLTVLIFSVERFLTISKAAGKNSVVNFVLKVKKLINDGKVEEAQKECAVQKGSVANVISSALVKYEQVGNEKELTKEQKLLAIQKEIEEATSLELPALEQNLVILATISSVSTLVGLLGTVIGMIKAFSALANAGAPDSVALANGISEALINTALGIATAALAIIAYNMFTTKIDKLTYSIDEAGFSIVQSYASNYKN